MEIVERWIERIYIQMDECHSWLNIELDQIFYREKNDRCHESNRMPRGVNIDTTYSTGLSWIKSNV